MKSENYSNSTVQSVLDRLDGQTFLSQLGFKQEDYVNGDGEIKSYCPICNDRTKMSFIIDSETKRAHCTNLNCNGSNLNTDDGNLLELFALATESDVDSAIVKLAGPLKVPLEKVSPASTEISASPNCNFIEVGHFKEEGDEAPSLVPAEIDFQGQKGSGRGVFIALDQLEAFGRQFRKDAFHSHFCYDTGESEKIEALGKQAKLPILGDFFVVFDASSSAEIVHAINQAIDMVERLKQNYDVPYDSVCVFYTNKNIEVHIDHPVFGVKPNSQLGEIYRRMVCALVGLDPLKPQPTSAFSQINLGVYRYDYLTHLPGTVVSSGTRDIYKIRMSFGAFKRMSYQRLHEFSLRRPDLPAREVWRLPSPKAVEFYNTVESSLERDTQLDERDTIASLYYRVTEKEGGIATLKQIAPAMLRRLFDESRQILSTPSPALNKALAGGFCPGHLYVLAGQPGSGTSSLALQMLNHVAANENAQCYFVGLQRGVEEVFKRSLSFLGKITVDEIDAKRNDPQQLYEDKDFNRRIFAAYERYMQFSDTITILEGIAAGSLGRIIQLIKDKREAMVVKGLKSGAIILVIDSLQLMVAMMRSHWVEQTLEREYSPARELARWDVETLTSRLKALAREMDITVLATHELYSGTRVISSERSEISVAQQKLYLETQFADTVMVLSKQGASLRNLMDYFRVEFSGTPLAGKVPGIEKRLKQIEKDYLQTQEFEAMRSEFTILDIIKNRSGPRDKILFTYHKPISFFEPIDYLG